MSSKGNFFISVVILILGGVFAWYSNHANLTRLIVFLCGLAFVVPAAISLLSLFLSRKANTSAFMRMAQAVCGVGGLGLGLCIIFMPDVFRPLLSYAFGALLVIGGLMQEAQVSRHRHVVGYPGWLQVVPIVILVAGVVMLCVSALHTSEAERWVMLIVGIAAILFGINGIIAASMSHKALQPAEATIAHQHEAPATADTTISSATETAADENNENKTE